MPQLSLYLDDQEMASLRSRAKGAGVSLSRYVRTVLSEQPSAWPGNFWSTYGALQDESFQLPSDLDESLDRRTPSFD